MLKRWRFENCLIVALIVLQSCYAGYPPLPPVHVSIDSIASPLADSKRTYLLFPGNLDTSSNDLLFQEYSNYLEPVLASLNYTPAQSETEVDLAIFLSYGIGDPQLREYTYSRPSWGRLVFPR